MDQIGKIEYFEHFYSKRPIAAATLKVPP